MDAPAAQTALQDFTDSAGDAARLLKLMAHEGRLLVLCHLVSDGELSVSALQDRVGLSQSALSQHLTRLRLDGLIAGRRDAQNIYYSLADPKAERVLGVLKDLYCPD